MKTLIGERLRTALPFPALLALSAFGAMVGLILLGHTVRSRQTFTFRGEVETVKVHPSALSELTGGKQPVEGQLSADTLIASGTTLEFLFDSPSTQAKMVKPSKSGHVAIWSFGEPNLVELRFPTSGEVTFLGFPHDPCVTTKMTLAIIFRGPISGPLWRFGKPTKEFTTIFDGFPMADQVDPTKICCVRGHYFEKKQWPLMHCGAGPLVGYRVGVCDNRLNVDYVPWLGLCCSTTDRPYTFGFFASKVTLEGASGESFIAGRSIGSINGAVMVPAGDGDLNVKVVSRGEKLEAVISGRTASVLLEGKELVTPWLTDLTAQYPVAVGIVTALVSGFLGAVIASRGRVLETWFRTRRDK